MTIHKPLHPGIIVRNTLINDETELNVTRAAKKLGVDRTTLSRLLNCHTGISPEMALRLSIFLGTSLAMWMNLQRDYDIWSIDKKRSKMNIKPLKNVA